MKIPTPHKDGLAINDVTMMNMMVPHHSDDGGDDRQHLAVDETSTMLGTEKANAVNSSESTDKMGESASGENGGVEKEVKSVESWRSWLMLVNVYVGLTITYGLTSTAGVFHVIFLDQFDASNAFTAWIGSVNMATSMMSAWLCSLCLRLYGPRICVALGVALCAAGAFTSSFATSVYHLILTFGLVTGCGVGFVYLALGECMNLWFDKNLALATGIGSSALGMASFVYPPIIRSLTDTYAWRGTFIVLSGLVLQYMVLACFARPPKSRPMVKSKLEIDDVFRLSLFKEPLFVCFILAEFGFHAGINIIQVHLENFVKSGDFGRVFTHWAIPVMGIANALGRFAFGLLGNLGRVRAQTMMIAFVSLGGVVMLVIPSVSNGECLLLCSGVYGLFMGVIGYATYVVVVDYFGQERMSSAFGYVCLSNGLGFFGGAPIAGWIYDVTDKYAYSMYLGGALHIVPWFPLIVTSAHRRMTSLTLTDKTNS